MKKRCFYLMGSNPKNPLDLTLFVRGFFRRLSRIVASARGESLIISYIS